MTEKEYRNMEKGKKRRRIYQLILYGGKGDEEKRGKSVEGKIVKIKEIKDLDKGKHWMEEIREENKKGE